MAPLISRLWTRLVAKRVPLSIMIVGLDNSGKTSILNSLISLGGSNVTSSASSSAHTSSGNHKTTSGGWPSSPSPLDDRGNSQEKSSSCNIMPTVGYNYERVQYNGLTLTILDFSGQNRYRNLWQEFYNSVDGIVFVIDSSDLIRLVVVRDELETMLSHPYFGTLSANNTAERQQLSVGTPGAAELAQKQITISQGKLIQMPLDTSASSSSHSTPSKIGAVFHSQQHSGRGKSRQRTRVPLLFLANKCDLANSVDPEVITKALNLNQLPIDRHPWSIQSTSVSMNQGIAEAFDWLVSQLSAG